MMMLNIAVIIYINFNSSPMRSFVISYLYCFSEVILSQQIRNRTVNKALSVWNANRIGEKLTFTCAVM